MPKLELKKFQRKAKKLLHKWKKAEETNDFDETSIPYKLVSVYLINFGGKKKKGVRSPPVSGSGLYYVLEIKDDEVKLLHPVLLDIYVASKRQFEKGITDVWWPNEAAVKDPSVKNRQGYFCNRFNVAETMLNKLKDFDRRGKLTKKLQDAIRKAIADLKEIPIDKVPKFKLPEKVDHISLWKETMANKLYKKKAAADLKKFNSKKDEGEKMSKKDKKKVSSSASDSDQKSKKASKKSKKSKTEKGSKPESGPKAPRGKKTAVAIVIQMLLKKKGKKVSISDMQAAIQKAKGMKKEFPEKKITSKIKQMTKWAEKNELKLKASSSGMTLS